MSANTNLTEWLPIEWDSEVIQRVLKLSAVEANALATPMSTSTKRILRAGAFNVTTGSSYTDDTSDLDYVTLTARGFRGKTNLDEDTLNDVESIADAISQRAYDWAVSYANQLDNACLAVTGAENGTTIPFTSVYKAVRTNGADVTSAYVADANYVSYNGTASAAYDKFSELLRLVEVGEYFDQSNALVIANHAFRDVIRRTKDNDGMPVFVQGIAGTPDTLFNIPISWSRGAKTSATNTSAPAGNPLMVFCGDRRLLKLGVRSGPETLVKAADAADTTDETALKLRSRRGFAAGNVYGFSVLEKTA
ncbi:phage major capsid protein [Streptomyces sp. FR-108]|uniref:phage major capsid protein n=1 Tax=Streptomyces sp. FR-108 TaxID=3416665 RepID=UPI003CFB5ED9